MLQNAKHRREFFKHTQTAECIVHAQPEHLILVRKINESKLASL